MQTSSSGPRTSIMWRTGPTKITGGSDSIIHRRQVRDDSTLEAAPGHDDRRTIKGSEFKRRAAGSALMGQRREREGSLRH